MSEIGLSAGPELILRFANERPIPAAAFGALLRTLASEYHQAYGGELEIVAMPEGSLMVKLRDFAKFAEGANHIIDFGTKIAGLVAAGAVGVAAVTAIVDKDSPIKSSQELVKLASDTGSALEIRYSEPGKSEILIKVSPPQLNSARRSLPAAAKVKRRLREPTDHPTILKSESALHTLQDTDARLLLKRQLASLSARPGGLGSVEPELMSLIVSLVRALHESAPYRLSSLITELEIEGHIQAAQLIRQITGDDFGKNLATVHVER